MITSNPVSQVRKNRGIGNSLIKVPDEKWIRIFGKKEYKSRDRIVKINRKDTACRGDYGLARECDKVLSDYTRFKEKRAREQIKKEYFGRQQDYRDKLRNQRELNRVDNFSH